MPYVIQVTDKTWLTSADIATSAKTSADRRAAWVFDEREDAIDVAGALRGRGYHTAAVVDATANAKRFEPGVGVPANETCESISDQIMAVLNKVDEPWSANDICAAVRGRRQDVLRAIKALAQAGVILARGDGYFGRESVRAQWVPDPVHEPEHYQARDGSDIECIDAIRAMLTNEEFRGYLRGNALKYQWRYRAKSGSEDLAKARRYLDMLTEHEDKQ